MDFLLDMGFKRDKIVEALRVNKNDVNLALDWLWANATPEKEEVCALLVLGDITVMESFRPSKKLPSAKFRSIHFPLLDPVHVHQFHARCLAKCLQGCLNFLTLTDKAVKIL